ncbi:MAG: hypothetical protein K2K12_00870, partial [Clostridia bacterium]|nr:hypothetical protein [Clostridia bacterium]
GVVFGIIAFPVRYLLTEAGAYVVFALLTAFSVFLILMLTPLKNYLKPSLGLNKREKKVKTEGTRDYPAAFEFDDLSAPETRSMASEIEVTPAPKPAPQPVPVAQQPAPAPKSAKEESRDILFSNDPASSYRNNLIFSRDSQFNTNPRRSSVSVQRAGEPSAEPASTAPRMYTYEPTKPDYIKPSYTPPSYSERYSAQAQSARPAMPRKVTPAEKTTYTENDTGYTPAPSYRAPSVPEEKYVEERDADYTPTPSYHAPSAPQEKHDYYSHDVEPVYSEPEVEEDEDLSTSYTEAALNAEQETPEEETEQTRDEMFRSIFSRPVEQMRTEISESRQSFSRGSDFRGAEPVEEEPAIERESTFDEPLDAPRFGFGDKDVEESIEEPSRSFDMPSRGSASDLFDTDEPEFDDADYREEPPVPPTRTRSFREESPRGRDSFRGEGRGEGLRGSSFGSPVPDAPAPQIKKHVYRPYRRPSNDLLFTYDDTVTVSQDEIEHNSSVIVETLAGFRVDAEVVKVRSGSAVTRYDIDIPKNIAVRTVIKRDAEIAMRLHARDGVNIYSNSEVGAISIEVPNSKRATVGLRSVLMADEYVNAKPNSLMFAIGKDIEGRNVCGNIVKMKHILVAGSTGSGKSVCLNAMLISLICRYSPADLRLILIDPKKVEFAIFDGLPHLMINEIIADAQKAVSALNWAIKEMERRYILFEQKTRAGINVHNVDEYNASLTEDEEKLPKIVIVVDELADLMSVAKKDIEDRIQRLAQKARAAGMHLVIATQRPSVDVITGVI